MLILKYKIFFSIISTCSRQSFLSHSPFFLLVPSSIVFYATGDKTPPDKSGGGTDRKPEITLDENSGLQLTDGKPDPDAIKSGITTYHSLG